MHAIPALLSALLPDGCPACDGPGGVSDSRLCQACAAQIPALPRAFAAPSPLLAAFALGPYAGPLGALVRRAKYRPDPGAALELGRRLGEAARGRMPRVDAVVHVPVPFRRRLRRGFDQGELLARAVGQQLGAPHLAPLRRVRPAEQAGRSHRERALGARGAFLARDGVALPDHLLLVDDVCTTGGTAAACATELLGAGARSVTLLVVAARGV